MTARTATHPSPDTLAAFDRGALPAHEQAEVEAHVAACDSCCAALAALSQDRIVSLARQAAADLPPTADSMLVPDVPPELVDHPRYRILGQLGAGGMGVVFKAEHRVMDRVVALKVVSRRYTASPAAAERFRREVRAAAKLDHANIVRAHDAEEANGLHFLVMECVEGVSLDRLVARRGPLPVATACQCVRQAALGLQHAHERGMVHRDIKPHNLMVTRKGQVKVLDFGLARLAAEADPPAPADGSPVPDGAVTTPSLVLGTPDYLAPEQARNAHNVDIRADIYSLGCVLYFLLTGKPPFAGFGAGIEKMLAHVQDDPAPVRSLRPEVPAALAEVLDKMLSKDPAGRFGTPAEVAAAVKPFTKADAGIDEQPDVIEPPPLPAAAAPTLGLNRADTDVAAPRPTKRRPATKRRRPRRPWPLIAAGAFVGAMVITIGLFAAFGDKGSSGDAKTGKDGRGAESTGGSATGKRVLFVVPRRDLYYPDYGPVKDRLAQGGLEVVTAGTDVGDCRLVKAPAGVVVRADRRVADIKLSDYVAVLFCGRDTSELTNDPAVGRLVSEATATGKVLGAICLGQKVLLYFDAVRGRKMAVCPSFPDPKTIYTQAGVLPWTVPVFTDGRVVTAAGSDDAPRFAEAVLTALRQ